MDKFICDQCGKEDFDFNLWQYKNDDLCPNCFIENNNGDCRMYILKWKCDWCHTMYNENIEKNCSFYIKNEQFIQCPNCEHDDIYRLE